MGGEILENANPAVFKKISERKISDSDLDENFEDPIDPREIFDHIRSINDPEHPLTLEELNVVDEQMIQVRNDSISVLFTPTIPHCSMATLIGLCIKVKLMRSLPSFYKIDVSIKQGSHVSDAAISKQLADKERIAAALENLSLLRVVNQCLSSKNTDI